jgi:hypothetical protein
MELAGGGVTSYGTQLPIFETRIEMFVKEIHAEAETRNHKYRVGQTQLGSF